MAYIQTSGEHKRTFVLLHGRGDTADSFGPDILDEKWDCDQSLRNTFTGAKFIFPQAPLRSLAAHPGERYYQWFDVMDLLPGSEEADLQVEGLRDTIQRVHTLLRQEIELVGADNVILGGLSQGCASSLISFLLWDGPPFVAYIGMCGWLPFRKLLEDGLRQGMGTKAEIIAESTLDLNSIATLARKMGYPDSFTPPLGYKKIPVFMGHGEADAVVLPRLGKEAASCLTAMGANVTFKEYKGLDHWYSAEMLQDIVKFLSGDHERHERLRIC